jgi:peptidoglycan/xylan/chitin deacetylase (PgdA/CDA1 family)
MVLAFHGVTSGPPGHFCNDEGLHLHLPIFARLMEHVAARYRPVPLLRVVEWLEGGGPAPERAVVVTFDDGFRNVLTDAAPLLQRLRIPATVFVAADFVFHGKMLWPDRLASALFLTRERRLEADWGSERRGFDLSHEAAKIAAYHALCAFAKSLPQERRLAFLDDVILRLGVEESRLSGAWDGFRPLEPDDLRRLPGFGVEVGSHTCSHPILSRVGIAETRRELQESKRLIEEATGRPCVEFAYPNGGPGDFNDETRREVMAAGYRCAVTTIKRRVTTRDDAFSIPRCTLTHNRISTAEFAAEVSGFPGALRALRGRLRRTTAR